MTADEVIVKAEKQIRDNGYKPFALWYNHDTYEFIITTQDIDYSKQMTLIKKY